MTIDITTSTNNPPQPSIINDYNKKPNELYHRCFQNYYHSYEYLKPDPIYISSVEATVNHWQLRDLLKFDKSSNEVYFTKGKSISSLNVGDNSSKEYFNLGYLPRCFGHANDGTVVTGGLLTITPDFNLQNIPALASSSPSSMLSAKRTSKGLFSFYNPELNIEKTVRLGELINNDVAIYKESNSTYLSYVCNNDSFLYCVDINNNNMKVTNKINCEPNVCLNHVTRNPVHEKLLTVTGDCKSIFLVDPKSSNAVVKNIKTNHDSGFGTSYHENGYLFSTVFQDGSCVLYDLRNIKNDEPLITVKSTRPSHHSGAFRVCKFSPTNDVNDMLIISEHVGRIHVLDLRHLDYNNVDDHQVIVVPHALEQFSDCQKSQNPQVEELTKLKSTKHTPIDIYGAESFPASLVYDYDYVSNSNPKLFKEFVYVPPRSKKEHTPQKLNYQCEEKQPRNDHDMQYAYDNLDEGSLRPETRQESSYYTMHCDDSYQQAINHVHGETDICGIEFCSPDGGDLKVLIGCQKGGVLVWDVNGESRRSFGSWGYV